MSVLYIAGVWDTEAPRWWPMSPSEGTYWRSTPNISQDEEGMKRLFVQFSFPGGIPSHVAPGDAGIDSRGRRAGYAFRTRSGAAFDPIHRRLRRRRR